MSCGEPVGEAAFAAARGVPEEREDLLLPRPGARHRGGVLVGVERATFGVGAVEALQGDQQRGGALPDEAMCMDEQRADRVPDGAEHRVARLRSAGERRDLLPRPALEVLVEAGALQPGTDLAGRPRGNPAVGAFPERLALAETGFNHRPEGGLLRRGYGRGRIVAGVGGLDDAPHLEQLGAFAVAEELLAPHAAEGELRELAGSLAGRSATPAFVRRPLVLLLPVFA